MNILEIKVEKETSRAVSHESEKRDFKTGIIENVSRVRLETKIKTISLNGKNRYSFTRHTNIGITLTINTFS